MNQLITLCKTTQLKEGKPLAVECAGFPALVVYKYQDEYFVTDNLCSHGGALLSQGQQEKDQVRCLFHGGAFSIKTGEATKSPCYTPITSYPVTLINDDVCIASQS